MENPKFVHDFVVAGGLQEKYVLNLIRQVLPPEDFEVTTMGDNNWISKRFRTHELFALLTATPEQRHAAEIATIDTLAKKV